MEKTLFQNKIIKCIEDNFLKFSPTSSIDIKLFFELKPLIDQVVQCMIFEFHHASITLTNHILERLLKLALIYNKTGVGPFKIHEWNKIFEKPNTQYGSLSLYQTIIECDKNELINDKEKEYLCKTIKELIRNGFSHADASKILSNIPDTADLFLGKLAIPSKLEKVTLNQKQIPPLQAILINNFAEANSASYFLFVTQLLLKIEKILLLKSTST